MRLKKVKEIPQPPLVVRLPKGERWSWNQKRDQAFPRNNAIIESLVQDGELLNLLGEPAPQPSAAELKVAAKEAFHRVMKDAQARNVFPAELSGDDLDNHVRAHFPALFKVLTRLLKILETELPDKAEKDGVTK